MTYLIYILQLLDIFIFPKQIMNAGMKSGIAGSKLYKQLLPFYVYYPKNFPELPHHQQVWGYVYGCFICNTGDPVFGIVLFFFSYGTCYYLMDTT